MIPYVPHQYWPQRYQRQGRNYTAKGGREQFAQEQLAAVAPWLRELVKGESVLDFGCGPQRFRPMLEDGGRRRYEGVDLIPGLGTMSLAEPLPEAEFDCVVAVWVLQHIVAEDQYRYWIGQLWRTLKPGGRLVVVDAVPLPHVDHAPHMGPRGLDAIMNAAPWDGEGELVTVVTDFSWVGWIEKPKGEVAWTPPERPASVVIPGRMRTPPPAPKRPVRVQRVSMPPARARNQPPPETVQNPPAMPIIAPGAMPEVRDRTRAIVIGGGECIWTDVRALEELIGHEWDGLVIAANDVGVVWPRPLHHWATLHPEKFKKWQEQRRKNGLPEAGRLWSRRGRTGSHSTVVPWAGGSSGMLAVTVARELGCTRIVLCGVPMTRTPHFQESVVHPRGRVWSSADTHWRSWTKPEVLEHMRPYVRSMSGRTQQLLGAPTREWLLGETAAAVEVGNDEEA